MFKFNKLNKWTTSIIWMWAFLLLLHFQLPGTQEGKFFPVVENFVITKVEPVTGNGMWVYGSFDKIRNCSYSGLEAHLVRRADETEVKTKINVIFEDREMVRYAGDNTYGPWRMNITPSQIKLLEFSFFHDCHRFWRTVTKGDMSNNILLTR